MARRQTTEGRRLTAVFRVREFTGLWSAELVSIVGDQLARIAFSVIVYERTGSAAWSALVYALTFFPALLGGVLLGWVADRYPRRRVMIASDLLRVLLIVPMAIPGIPLVALGALIVVTVLLATPHTSAQGALLPEVLPGDLLERGFAVRQITNQTAQIVGFVGGGALLALIDARVALLVNALTFAVSAGLLWALVRPRPAPVSEQEDAGEGWTTKIREGLHVVFGDRALRTLVIVIWLGACYIAPEGLAVPIASMYDAGPLALGLLMASIPAGSVLGAFASTRWISPERRERAIVPCAVVAGIPLIFTALAPNIWVAIPLWVVTGGFFAASLVQAQASFVRAAPAAVRGRATGLAASGLVAAQGVGVLVGGLVAEELSPTVAVSVVGAGTVLGLLVVAMSRGGRALRREATEDDSR